MSSNSGAWKELKQDLHLPTAESTVPAEVSLLTPEATKLEKEVLKAWGRYEKSERELGPLLYQLCTELNAQGKKGAGFRLWLETHKKPKSTAYRWIRAYSVREGLELPFPDKSKTKKTSLTSSQTGQSASTTVVPDTASFIAPPVSVNEAISVLAQFLNKVAPTERQRCANEIHDWLGTYLENLQVSPSEEAANAPE